MYSQTLIAFLRENVDRLFQTWPIEIINARLHRLGKQRVTFVHRTGEGFCHLRLHSISPRNLYFFWEEEERFVCGTDYFMVKYGKRPNDAAVMVELVGVRAGELFPLDFLAISLI